MKWATGSIEQRKAFVLQGWKRCKRCKIGVKLTMWKLNKLILMLVWSLVVWPHWARVQAVRFKLQPGERRCFTQDLPTGRKVNGEVEVSGSKGDMSIDVWVTTLQGVVIYHRCAHAHGKLTFRTPESVAGSHEEEGSLQDMREDEDTFKVCIEHQQQPSTAHEAHTERSITVGFQEADRSFWKRERPALASDTDRLLRSMRTIHTSLVGMIGDLSQLEQRERSLTKGIMNTGWRVSVLAAISFMTVVLISFLQFRYYRDFFKQKKLC